MSFKGRGNGKHDAVIYRSSFQPSEISNERMEQYYKNKAIAIKTGILFENKEIGWNVARVCIICNISFDHKGRRKTMHVQNNESYKCLDCGLIVFPKGVLNNK